MKLQIRFNWEFSFEIRALQLTWWELWKCTFKRADYMHWRLGSWRLFHFRSHCTNAQRAVSALRKLICGLIQQKCPYIQNQIICLFLDLISFHTQLIKQPFKPKIRKVWIIPTRPWMWKKTGITKESHSLWQEAATIGVDTVFLTWDHRQAWWTSWDNHHHHHHHYHHHCHHYHCIQIIQW